MNFGERLSEPAKGAHMFAGDLRFAIGHLFLRGADMGFGGNNFRG
jgi:hypothetical protein